MATSSFRNKIKSSWLPSAPSAPVIAVCMGIIGFGIFYYFDYSNRQANLVKRAFRHLTLIGDTIASQTENYHKAILNSPANIDEQYLATFLPGVQYSDENSKNYQENSIISEDDNYYLFLKIAPVNRKPIYLKAPILSLLKDRRSTSISSDIFDDVLLADKNGTVIFQANQTAARIVQMGTLIDYAQGPGAGTGDANKQTTDNKIQANSFIERSTFSNLLDVQIAGANHKLFLQPLYLKIGNVETGPDRPHYVLSGLVRSDQFFIESLRVPYVVLIWSAFSAFILGLSLPFLKMIFLKSRERFLRADAIRICLFLPVITFILSLALISLLYFRNERDTDKKLTTFGEMISHNFSRELSAVRNQLDSMGQSEAIKEYPNNLDSISRVPDALKTVVTSYDSEGVYPFFNSAFWMNSKGQHVILWTVRDKAPPLLDVGNRAYARNLFERKYSYLTTGPQEKPITLEPINSWITGENSLVSCIPHPIGGAGMVTKPLSLIGPYVPLGFGYAVVNGNGLVLFHNEESRNLVENLFEEADMNRSLSKAVKEHEDSYLNVSYRGQDHRFHVTSFQQLEHLPWTLVVFRQKAPLRIFYTEVIIESLVLFLLLYAVICMVTCLLLRSSASVSSREDRAKYFPRWLWPNKRRLHHYLLLNTIFLALSVAALAFLWAGSVSVLFLGAVTIPIIAAMSYLLILRSERSPKLFLRAVPHWQLFYRSALAMMLLLVAVFPSLAFFRICVSYEEDLGIKQEQLNLASFYQNRAEKVAAAYQRINFPSAEKREEFLKTRLKVGREALDSYETIGSDINTVLVQNHYHCGNSESGPVEAFIPAVLTQIRPSLDRFTSAPGTSKYGPPSDFDWRVCRTARMPELMLDHYRGDQALLLKSGMIPTQLPGGLAHYAGMLALILVLYRLVTFASRKLFSQAFENRTATFRNGLPEVSSDARNTIVICSPDAREELAIEKIYPSSAVVVEISNVIDSYRQNGKRCELKLDGSSVVILNHFEFRMEDARCNLEKLELLEDLVLKQGKTIFIISTVDPLYYLDIGQLAELPGNELGEARKELVERWAEILQSFAKHYYSKATKESDDSQVNAEKFIETPDQLGGSTDESRRVIEVLRQECALFPHLQRIEAEISPQISSGAVSAEQVIDEIGDRAHAYYHSLWSQLSIKEKLLLVQLSQEGFVNPNSGKLANVLMRKGLLIHDQNLRIFNESFRRFVASVETADQIKFWEQKSMKGGWGSIRVVFWAGLISLVAFLLYTQRDLLQSGVAWLPAIIGAIAGLLKVLDEIHNKHLGSQPEKS